MGNGSSVSGRDRIKGFLYKLSGAINSGAPPDGRMGCSRNLGTAGTLEQQAGTAEPPPGNVTMTHVPSTQPAIMKPTEESPAYTQISKEHALAQAELLKRQEELERKAAELDRKEREMQSVNQQGGKKK
ncbi:secretory carrier-associated membrane protein 1-like isoform X1 [Passer domesticus]|uniref:secretory carrier-associated membrane protein 1-like isoform X1 n=1 Tax=Passer domesticus TaxID=48849 RepID=UPI0030FEECEF